MIRQYRGAPSWDEISRIGQFVIDRTGEAVTARAERLDASDLSDVDAAERDKMDQALAVLRTVNELRAAPAARFHSESEPAHEAADDSAKRRVNFAALVAMANDYRTHPGWDHDWPQ